MSNSFRIDLQLDNRCPLCHDGMEAESIFCHNCIRHQERLEHGPCPLLILSVFNRSHPLRDVLHDYKDDTSTEQIHAQQALTVRLAQKLTPLLPTGTTLTTVPPTSGRHNYLHDVATTAGLNPVHTLESNYPRHERIADPHQFRAINTDIEDRVMLLEDAYVTGATAQSAANTLRAAGCNVLGIVAIGRRINPEHLPQNR